MSFPSWIKPVSDFISEEYSASIVVKRFGANLHAGIVYRESSKINLFHLASHKLLINESSENKTGYFYIQPLEVDPSNLFLVAGYCRKIFRSCGRSSISYNLLHKDETIFDKDGNLILGEGCTGLTCATFVMAVFETAGITLINTQSWISRESDLQWQQYIIEEIGNNADLDHIEKMKQEKGAFRFRPSEVAGSLRCEEKPGEFEQVQKLGAVVETYV